MSESQKHDFVTMLTYIVDENREARDLVRISQAGLARRSQSWKERFGQSVRTGSGIASGLSAQYLGENLFRARGHWTAVLGHVAEVLAVASASDQLQLFEYELREAGIDEVAEQLVYESVPYDRKKAAEHLQTVLDRMSACDDVVVRARSRMLLQRMREN